MKGKRTHMLRMEYAISMKMMFCAIFLLGTFQTTSADVAIEIFFQRYTASCKEDINNNDCDPMFTFCLDRPRTSSSLSPCYYGYVGESGHFQNSNNINLAGYTNIKGIPNPWPMHKPYLMDPSMKLVARVRDDDNFGDDHLVTMGMTLTQKVYGSRDEAIWQDRTISAGSYAIAFKIRVYCEANYYSTNCSKFCEPQDTEYGHYLCEKGTGNKVCMRGWTGDHCTEDIDECALNFCERGTCENLLGDYICHCPPNYTGKNCTNIGDPCDSLPCSNNATCDSNLDTYTYSCSCVGDWIGEHCDEKPLPCDSKPCQNGANCVNSDNVTSYTCECKYPFTGDHCEILIPGATTTDTPVTAPVTEQPAARVGVENDEKGGFLLWHGILICILILIVLVIIIACFVVRRRRRKQKDKHDGLPPGDTIITFNGGENLSFENNMYNDVNRNGAARLAAIAPTTPTDDELFNPVKPVFYPDDVDSQGAAGGYHDMDADGYVKPSSSIKSKPDAMVPGRSPGLERALSNPYTDLGALRGRPKPEAEEVHYHDLDETRMAMKDLDDAFKDDDVDDDDDIVNAVGPLSFDLRPHDGDSRGERPYSDIPNNIPVPPLPPLRGDSHKGFSSLSHSDHGDDDDVPMPEWNAPDPPRLSATDDPLTEPVTVSSTEIKPKVLSTFKEGPYAEVTLDTNVRTSDPFAGEVKLDEDDVPHFGLPSTFGSTNGGYDTPTGSQRKHPSFNAQESPYDSPRSSQPSNRTSTNSEYDSPKSSQPVSPPPKPPVAPKPPTRTSSNKSDPEDHENDLPPPPPLDLDAHEEDIEEEEDDGDAFPRNLKMREGRTFDDYDGHKFETNVDDHAPIVKNENGNTAPGLFMENHLFSLEDE